jgi:hypothetical protein
MRTVLAIILSSSLVVSPCAYAATVYATLGQVLVNKGQGYKQVSGSTEAEPGTTVVVNPGSHAQVVYPDGCRVPVIPGAVYAVAPQSPCATEGTGETGGIGLSTTTLVVGGVVVAGAAAAALLLTQKSKPASP